MLAYLVLHVGIKALLRLIAHRKTEIAGACPFVVFPVERQEAILGVRAVEPA
jgi:hypothetical protein